MKRNNDGPEFNGTLIPVGSGFRWEGEITLPGMAPQKVRSGPDIFLTRKAAEIDLEREVKVLLQAAAQSLGWPAIDGFVDLHSGRIIHPKDFGEGK